MKVVKKVKLAVGIFGLASLAFLMGFGQNAYAISSSVQITRSNPGAVQFMNGDSTSVQPSSAGTLVVGSDTINVNTNCSAGYDVYVSATSAGSRDLVLSGTTGSIPDNKRIAASSTAIGSETTLAKDTWGVGKTNSTFAGLQAYNASTTSMTPSFHDTTTGGKDFTFYYGANVSNVKTPGTYTGEVLYTVLAKATCVEYTLSFDTSSATSVPSPGTYNTRTIGVDETINLATISSSSNIRKTGYHITGWRNQNDTTQTYGISGSVDVNPSDASSVILEPIWAANTYTISYNANAPSGTTPGGSAVSSDTMTYGANFTFSANSWSVSGYEFKGWSLSASTSPDATSGIYNTTSSYSAASISNAASVTDTNGATIDVYAIWKRSVIYMQEFTCASSGLSVGQQINVVDSRDNHTYKVKKLPDGKCWMVQNLTLGSSGSTNAQRTLTPANTNIDNGATYYLPPAGKQGAIDSSATLSSNTAANFGTSGDNRAKTQFRTADSSITNDSDTGYYNFYTATLGFAYYGTGSSGTSTRDICPKGWRLPKTTDGGTTVSTTGTANDFTYLVQRYNTNASWSGTATSYNYYTADATIHTGVHTGAADNGNNYAGFSYSGYWFGTNTSASNVGSHGYYWSASVRNTYYGYYLLFYSSDVCPQNDDYKYYGFAVRCLAKS